MLPLKSLVGECAQFSTWSAEPRPTFILGPGKLQLGLDFKDLVVKYLPHPKGLPSRPTVGMELEQALPG